MFIHCKPYKCYIYRFLTAVFAILLVSLYSSLANGANPSGKPKIALLGDSMTWIGGDSCQNETGWSHVLNRSGIASEIDMYARSGATWTNTSATRRNPQHYSELLHDDNVIYNQAIRLIERADTSDCTPDIIILFAGANDAWFVAKRPGIFENKSPAVKYDFATDPGDVTSLAGSITLVSDLLMKRFPESVLLFVTPLQMSKTDAETIFKVSDIIEKTASEKGWNTLRADKDTDIRHEEEAKSPKFTYDGVHTNAVGAKKLGEYILPHLIYLSDKHKLQTNPFTP